MLYAPYGGGKSTALLQYAALRRDTGFVTLPARASALEVAVCLARVSGAVCTIVDDADAASPAGQEALLAHLAATGRTGKRYVLSGASRSSMQALAALAHRDVVSIDPRVLAFTTAEVAELACASAIVVDEVEIERLVLETGGWPLAVAWILRDAARAPGDSRGAYERWRAHNGHLLHAFVSSAQGSTAAAPATVRAGGTGARLVLTLFGRFSCTINGRPVSFVRRRDQNLLIYLALAANASASRADLLATFWPGASRAVASQGLRTAMCRLRRALTLAGGCDGGEYVRSSGSRIALDLDLVTIDVRRFRDAVTRAQAEDAGGRSEGARALYLGAQRLYCDELLSSEAAEPALLVPAAEYGALLTFVQRRLAAIDAARDETSPGTSSSRSPIVRALPSSVPLPSSTTATAPLHLSKRRFGAT
jgi:hypothetical protein